MGILYFIAGIIRAVFYWASSCSECFWTVFFFFLSLDIVSSPIVSQSLTVTHITSRECLSDQGKIIASSFKRTIVHEK